MAAKKRSKILLLLSLLSLGGLVYMIVQVDPEKELTFEEFTIKIFYLIFPLLALFFIAIVGFLLKNIRLGFEVAFLAVAVALLLFFHYFTVYYLALLLVLVLVVELFFREKE